MKVKLLSVLSLQLSQLADLSLAGDTEGGNIQYSVQSEKFGNTDLKTSAKSIWYSTMYGAFTYFNLVMVKEITFACGACNSQSEQPNVNCQNLARNIVYLGTLGVFVANEHMNML